MGERGWAWEWNKSSYSTDTLVPDKIHCVRERRGEGGVRKSEKNSGFFFSSLSLVWVQMCNRGCTIWSNTRGIISLKRWVTLKQQRQLAIPQSTSHAHDIVGIVTWTPQLPPPLPSPRPPLPIRSIQVWSGVEKIQGLTSIRAPTQTVRLSIA